MMFTLKSMLILTAIRASAAPATPEIQRLNLTRYVRSMPAFTDAGLSAVTLSEFRVSLQYPSGKSGTGGLLVVFDALSGYFTTYLDSNPNLIC